MTKANKTIALLVCLLIWLTLCRPSQPLVGRWRTEAPTSLLFEYRADGTILLLDETDTFVVFHYKLIDDNSLRFFDGMGRVRDYDFSISGDTLTFYEDLDSGVIVEKYKRE